MIDIKRYKRLRLLVHTVNKARKKQAKQIDILCHDLIEVQRDYNRRLSVIGLTAGLYKSILGITDLDTLLNVASAHMVETTGVTRAAFVLRNGSQYKTWVCSELTAPGESEIRLEELFTPEVMDGLCNAGKACSMDDMLALGLQIRPTDFAQVSALTVPLADGVCARGFMLLYQEPGQRLRAIQIKQLTSIAGGLTKAIMACEMPSRSA